LLEGLGIVEINYSDLKEEYSKLRIDAEFYKKEYVQYDKKIKSKGFLKIGDISFVTDGIHQSIDFDITSNINLISAKSPKENFFDLSSNHHISSKQNQKNPRTELQANDVIISTVGTIGNSCKISKGVKAVVNQRIMKIIPKNFNNEVLPLVINSVIGELQLNRIGTGGVQTNISSTDIRKIFIPKLKESIQQQIVELIEQSFTLKKQSEHLLETAKRLVEIAIEENEAVALAFIKKETA